MSRLLAIDYGTRRTGIAVTDPLQIIATPLEGVRTMDLEDYLQKYFEKEDVSEVVIGWPTKEDGSPTSNTKNVQAFVNRFKKIFPDIPVVLHDEWNTSNEALHGMIASGTRKKQRREKMNIDMASAVIILQSYMDERS